MGRVTMPYEGDGRSTTQRARYLARSTRLRKVEADETYRHTVHPTPQGVHPYHRTRYTEALYETPVCQS